MTGMGLGLLLLGILILLLLSAFFSGSETALTAISRARLHALELEGNKRALVVVKLREDKERLIGTLMLGNSLVNVGASALATAAALQLFGYQGVAIATFVLALIIIIFSEVLPKTYALQHSERAALLVAPPMALLVKLSYPVTTIIHTIVHRILRLLGAEKSNTFVSARAALRGSIELHHREGDMIKQDRDMLGGLLDLEEIPISDIMVHRKDMLTLSIDLPPEKILDQIIKGPYSRVPLWKDNPENIVGVLHTRDLLRALRRHCSEVSSIPISLLAWKPWFVPETTSLKDQLQAFGRKHNPFALVVDEYGSLKGLVTLEDILEEVVGQIYDEYDPRISGIRVQADNSVVVSGTVTLRDLNRTRDWNLPDEHASTVAGLVMHEARYIPEVGESFIFHGYSFDILQKEKNQITLLRMEKLEMPEEESH